jgi:16S rRNA (guanine527-N7)-methyltransferase
MSVVITPDRAIAEAYLAARDVPRGTVDRLDHFAALLLAESETQNLIARSTHETLWTRHLVDSAQLLDHMPPGARTWLDIGSGAGLPGIVIALVSDLAVTMVEPRRRRVEFLRSATDALGLSSRVTIVGSKIERLAPALYDVISARAVASLETLFEISTPFAKTETRWILPKGRGAHEELASTQRTWQGQFRTVPSVTDAEAAIIIADGVRRRQR